MRGDNKSKKESMWEILVEFWLRVRLALLELQHTVKQELPKILPITIVAILILGVASISAYMTETPIHFEQLSVHLAIELLGAVLLFVLLERDIERALELKISKIRDYDRFPIDDFIQMMPTVNIIRIQDFSLVTLLGSENGYYRKPFLDALRQALGRKNIKVEILIARPNSDEAKARANVLAETAHAIHADIVDATETLLSFVTEVRSRVPNASVVGDKRNGEGQLQVRFYDGHPGFAFYQAGKAAYVAFYTGGGRTMQKCQLLIPMKSTFGGYLSDNFEKLSAAANSQWTDSEAKQWLNEFRGARS